MIRTALVKLIGIIAVLLVVGTLLHGCAQKQPCQPAKEPAETKPPVQKAPAEKLPAEKPQQEESQTTPAAEPAKNAETILTEMFETYRNARTYHVKGELKMIYHYKETDKQAEQKFPLEMHFKRPDKIFLRYLMGWTIFNGTEAVEYNPQGNTYMKGPAPKKLSIMPFGAAMMVQPHEILGLLSDQPISKLVQQYPGLKYQGSEQLDGQMMDIVSYRQGTMSTRLWIGQDDRVVHKGHFVMVYAPSRQAGQPRTAPAFDKTVGDLIYQIVELNKPIDDEVFTFKPPEAAKQIELKKPPQRRPTRQPRRQRPITRPAGRPVSSPTG